MSMNPGFPSDLCDAAPGIREKRFSSVELTEFCLDRIERLQPHLKCFICVNPERALAAAWAADAQLARGESEGPLHGALMAHQDIFSRSGQASTCGSAMLRNFIPDKTATVLKRIHRVRAIELGSLNMTEFAAGGTGHNMHYGDCVNPWNTTYTPGGSSSGSACAVAARLVCGSFATDTAGSARWPASLCGMTGLRPTQGLVPLPSGMPRAPSLYTVGPMARSLRDCDAITDDGPHHQAGTLAANHRYEGATGQPVKGRRIGVPISGFQDDVPDEARFALEQSLEVFRRLGVEVLAIAVPDLGPAFSAGDIQSKFEAAALHRHWLRDRPGTTPRVFEPSVNRACTLRRRSTRFAQFLDSVFARVDALHLLVHPHAPPTMADCAPDSAQRVAEFCATYPRFTWPISYRGLPALVQPCGFSPRACRLAGNLRVHPMAKQFCSRSDMRSRKIVEGMRCLQLLRT